MGKSYDAKLVAANAHAERVLERRKIREAKHKNDAPKKLTTTKVVMVYMFVLMNIILAYAMLAMIYLQDLSALPVLITDIAAQVLVYAGYLCKSYGENHTGGIVFETAIREIEANLDKSDEGDEAVG